jgi:hypothetical protein
MLEVLSFFHLDALPADNPKRFEALFRACYWGSIYADGADGCGLLGEAFRVIGNVDAARAVWEHAPGCHTRDRGETPVNGCMGTLLQKRENIAAYSDDSKTLFAMAQEACSSVHDLPSCSYVSSHGDTEVDMDEVERLNRAKDEKAHNVIQTQIAEQEAAGDERRAEARERTNALRQLNDQVSQGGTAILNTGNEQAAAIRATGDANGAAQRQAAQQRLDAQKAQQAAQQTATQISSSSQPRTYKNMTQCVKVVSATYSSGDIREVITNTCGETIRVTVTHYRTHDTCVDGETMNIAPGASFAFGNSTDRNWYQAVADDNTDWAITGQGPALQIPNSCLDKYPVK